MFRKPVVPHHPAFITQKAPDGEVLQADYYTTQQKNLLILSHGLEGSAKRPYILGMVSAFLRRGWDVLAWYNRTCGPQPAILPKVYHSGFYVDLKQWLDWAVARGYPKIFLAGFSMGGNITMNLLGRPEVFSAPSLCGAAAISTPFSLAESSKTLEKGFNRVYTRYFLDKLQRKMASLHQRFPETIPVSMGNNFKTLRAFDHEVTAKLHGFDSADDYYDKASSLPYLKHIQVPLLLLNSKDDSFLGEVNFPAQDLLSTKTMAVYTDYGGHCGFMDSGEETFAERTVSAFAENCARIS